MADIWMDVDTALSEVPVNIMPLLDDTDFKTRETAIAYNAAGMDLVWNFVTSAGAYTQTAVTPTTAGTYDWAHQGDAMYSIEIPASGGASINNDTEGYGWFTGVVTGVLPWRGPIIGFRAAAINDSLCDAGTTGLLGPTVAGRTADISATGEIGLDFSNVNIPVGAIDALCWVDNGTLQSATSTTAVLRSAAAIGDDRINNSAIYIRSGTGAGQTRLITDYVTATDTATVSPAWTVTPDNTSVYAVVPMPPAPTDVAAMQSVNVAAISGDTTAADNCESFFDGTGYAGTGNVIPTVSSVTAVATGGITAGSIAADAIGASELAADAVTEIVTGVWAAAARTLTTLDEDSTTLDLDATIRSALGMAAANLDTQISSVQSDTNDIQTRLPAALVSGRMDASVGAMAANVLTAAATAADFGAEVADAVCDEALAGHATAGTVGAALSAASSAGDPWSTLLPGAYGAGTAGKLVGDNINATISSRASQTSVDTVDTVVDAVKLKTDQLNFTVAGEVDANTVSMNNTTVNGTGTSGDKWRGS